MFMTGLHGFQVHYIVYVVGGWIYHHAMSTSAPLPWPSPDSHPCSRFWTVTIFHHIHHQNPPPHRRSPHAAISATASILCSTLLFTPSTNPSPTPPPSSLPPERNDVVYTARPSQLPTSPTHAPLSYAQPLSYNRGTHDGRVRCLPRRAHSEQFCTHEAFHTVAFQTWSLMGSSS